MSVYLKTKVLLSVYYLGKVWFGSRSSCSSQCFYEIFKWESSLVKKTAI